MINDYSTPTGGAELELIELRERLRSRGHTVLLFSSAARSGSAEPAADNICFGTTSRWRTLVQTANPLARLRLARVVRDFKPDLAHVTLCLTQLSPLILPALAAIPCLYHAVWYRGVCATGKKTLPDGRHCQVQPGRTCLTNGCLPLHDWLALVGVQMPLWRRWRKVFQRVVAVSQAVRVELETSGFEGVEVIRAGVPVRTARPPLAGPPTVGFAGRLESCKGVDVLLHAFAGLRARFPEAKLLLAGDGPERSALRQQAESLNVLGSIEWGGLLSRQQTDEWLGRAWVQAVPSIWAEPYGMVAAEAAMRGTAVVASRTGGLPELVQPGRTGFLTTPADPAALTDALSKVLGDRPLAEQLGWAGRELALAEFSAESETDRFLEVYSALQAERPHAVARLGAKEAKLDY